jgi:hypothetical protein
MKKIYLSLFTVALALTSGAQTLTQAFNEPVIGNVNNTQFYDSAAVLPNTTGAGQMWNFSALTSNTVTESTSFTAVGSSGPNAGLYTGATMADFDGGSFHTYYKSTTNQLENLGFEDVNVVVLLSDPMIIGSFPFGMGSTFTDVAVGTCTAMVLGGMTGVADGTTTVTGTGTGTLMIPGGASFTNVLQTVSRTKINISIGGGAVTLNNDGVEYTYYHSSQKFPIMSVAYTTVTGSFPSYSADVKVNTSVITGLNDLNFDASFSIFPNPAKNNFNVKLNNANNAVCKMEIVNAIGALVRSVDLGTASEISQTISISGLAPGIYMVKTTLGNKVSARKLIVE